MRRDAFHHVEGKFTVEIALQLCLIQTPCHRLPPILPYTLANSLRPRATRLPMFVSLSDKLVAISRYESPCCLSSRQLLIGSLILSRARRASSIAWRRSKSSSGASTKKPLSAVLF